MCKRLLFLIAAFAVCLSLANHAYAQKKARSAATSAAKAKPQKPNSPAKAEIDKDKDAADKPLSPAKQAAREVLKEAEEQYKMIDVQIEAHENRIRLQRSIRVPPGVRPPQIDPVPLDLVQRRGGAWHALKEARQVYQQTP